MVKTALTSSRPYVSTRQEQLGTQIDEQVNNYDKAHSVMIALGMKRANALEFAISSEKIAAQKAKTLRLELCVKYHLQRASGGYYVKATNNDCFRFQ